MGGAQEVGLGEEVAALRETPGVAAVVVRGGEELGVAGLGRRANAVEQGGAQGQLGAVNICPEEAEPGPDEQQVDVKNAEAALAGEPKPFVHGVLGGGHLTGVALDSRPDERCLAEEFPSVSGDGPLVGPGEGSAGTWGRSTQQARFSTRSSL